LSVELCFGISTKKWKSLFGLQLTSLNKTISVLSDFLVCITFQSAIKTQPTFTFPFTSNFSVGLVVQIPTFKFGKTVIQSWSQGLTVILVPAQEVSSTESCLNA